METSRFAYYHLPLIINHAPPSLDANLDNPKVGTYGPLLWLFRLLMRFTLRTHAVEARPDLDVGTWVKACNRKVRRHVTREAFATNIGSLKHRVSFMRMLARGLTPRQFQEKKARLLIHGRIRVYGIRSAGSVLQRRARLVCYDHGWWRMPSTSALMGGMWDVQLPPN